jgi:hypothetical protein
MFENFSLAISTITHFSEELLSPASWCGASLRFLIESIVVVEGILLVKFKKK